MYRFWELRLFCDCQRCTVGYFPTAKFIRHKQEPDIEAFCQRENANATTRKTYGIPHTSILKNQHFHLYFLSYRQRRFAFGGRETVQLLLTGMPILSKFIAAGVGLIPSCYPSVLLTQLYLDNAITLGTMLAGTLSNAGLGYLVYTGLTRIGKRICAYSHYCTVWVLYSASLRKFCFKRSNGT